MRYDKFYACPYCGAALDPGEKCDCDFENEYKEDKHDDGTDHTDQANADIGNKYAQQAAV